MKSSVPGQSVGIRMCGMWMVLVGTFLFLWLTDAAFVRSGILIGEIDLGLLIAPLIPMGLVAVFFPDAPLA